MNRRRFFALADLTSSAMYFSIAGYFAVQYAEGNVPTFHEVGSAFFASDLSVFLAVAGIGVMLWKLPNLAMARFSFGIFALFVAYVISQDSAFASAPFAFRPGVADAATVAAFCILCVWLNVHRWILWNLRYPRRQVQ
jgi:hypothetical protein